MLQRRLLLAAAATSPLWLSGCASQSLDGYAREQPVLDLAQYFNGTVDAHGIFQDRGGQIIKRFTVVMDCRWDGASGVLDEAFSYSDGSTERRVWRLTKHADGRYSGTAGDVVGKAEGRVAGNAFRWQYTLALPVDGRVIDVNLDDWMYLIDERVMLNRATMSKFGVRLGEITLSFTRRGA